MVFGMEITVLYQTKYFWYEGNETGKQECIHIMPNIVNLYLYFYNISSGEDNQ